MEKFIPTNSLLKTHEDLEKLLNEGESYLRKLYDEEHLPEYKWNEILIETNNTLEKIISKTETLELIVENIEFKKFNTVIEFGISTIKLPNETRIEKIRGEDEVGNWIYEDEYGEKVYEPELYITTFKKVKINNPKLPPYKKDGFNKFSVPSVQFIFISSKVDSNIKIGDPFLFKLNFVHKFRFRKSYEYFVLNYYDKKDINYPVSKNSNKNCFIVTTTMGDVNHPVVTDFRRYRDEVLLNTYFGRLFIKMYYKVGPVLSKFIQTNSFLFSISKKMVLKIHKLINTK